MQVIIKNLLVNIHINLIAISLQESDSYGCPLLPLIYVNCHDFLEKIIVSVSSFKLVVTQS